MPEQGLEAQERIDELGEMLQEPEAPEYHTAARPLPVPRRRRGKGWATLWKVMAWLLCLCIIAGGTALGASYVNDTYGVFLELVPILVLAAFFVVSAVVGLSLLAGVMVVCGIARELSAVLGVVDALKRRQ